MAGQHDFWPEMSDYRRRFDEIQNQFIEEPRQAVQHAESLVEEVLDRMMKDFRSHLQGIHAHSEGDEADTEHLRRAMLGYRDFVNSLDNRRAA